MMALASLSVVSGGCSRENPRFGLDLELDEEIGAGDVDVDGAEAGSRGPEPGATGDGTGEDGGDAGPAEPLDPDDPQDDGLLLHASLDAIETMPEIGAGPSAIGSVAPESVPGVDGLALRFTDGSQWLAFPQHDGERVNVDHRLGRLELDVRAETDAPHLEPRDLLSLSGVVEDGGGIRVGIADILDGNRLWVQYIDAQGIGYLTRFPADLLPADEWVHLTLTWDAGAAEDEPNVELWIDDEAIDPLFGFASGPKVVGTASAEDVIVLGSWSLGGGASARASFDELAIYDTP